MIRCRGTLSRPELSTELNNGVTPLAEVVYPFLFGEVFGGCMMSDRE